MKNTNQQTDNNVGENGWHMALYNLSMRLWLCSIEIKHPHNKGDSL